MTRSREVIATTMMDIPKVVLNGGSKVGGPHVSPNPCLVKLMIS
jgi:hypothetical protein